MDIRSEWLEPTWFIDSGSAEVAQFVAEALDRCADDPLFDEIEVAVKLFLSVRDGIRYDPYLLTRDPEMYRASAVAASSSNWCTPKATLLTAAARHCGIPARLGFADVRNHLTTEKLSAHMGTDLFAWHGYTELLLGGQWFKVSSAFNIELCERFGVKVLDFDGTTDALMHPFDESGNRHMEYVNERGSFDDLPLDAMLSDFDEIYGEFIGGGDQADVAFSD